MTTSLFQAFHQKIFTINTRITVVLNRLVVLIMGLLVIDVLWGVFSRFVLGAQSSWTEELARFLLVWVSLFGAAVAFREKQHLGVDVFVNVLDRQAQMVVEYIVDLLSIVFAVTIFIYGGSLLVSTSVDMRQEMISLPFPKATLYIALPISGFFIFSFAIEDMLQRYIQWCPQQKEM